MNASDATQERIQQQISLVEALGIRLQKTVPYKQKSMGAAPVKSPADLAPFIEHTILKPEATLTNLRKLCEEAKEFRFRGVCVNPVYVADAKRFLAGTDCIVISVIGFPLGANLTRTKAEEAKAVIGAGADEVDMVLRIGALKEGEYRAVFEDIAAVVSSSNNIPIKVILEMTLLNENEKIIGCLLAERSGAAFVKTSTGFAGGGATVEDVRLMRAVVGDRMGIKAAGGIRDFETARAMIGAGADRLGCSASVAIVKQSLGAKNHMTL